MIALRVLVAVPNYTFQIAEAALVVALLVAVVLAAVVFWSVRVIGRAMSRRRAASAARPALGWGPVRRRYASGAAVALVGALCGVISLMPVLAIMVYDCGDWWWLWCAILA